MTQIYAPLRTRQHTMAANKDFTKAIASFFSEMIQIRSFSVFLSIYVSIIYSVGINFAWHKDWKCWTLASKNVRVEESKTRLEK